MTVVLTGGTGLVGSAVLRALRAAGHDVIAVVRSEQSAEAVRAAGAQPVVGDLTDNSWLGAQFAAADGAIHTASPGDATSADFDTAVAEAALAAFRGTGKPYVHTGGIWVYGAGRAITENAPFAPPRLTAWREAVEKLVLGDDSLRGAVVVPGVVYGDGSGLPALVTKPVDGDVRLVGDGVQHWTTVSTDQLADLYVRAFDNPVARGYYLGANDDHPTVRELGEAASAVRGGIPVVAETPEQTSDRIGDLLTEALLLDQVADNTKARTQLGWNPSGPSLLDEITHGSYAPRS